jgi:hypothetical protein
MNGRVRLATVAAGGLMLVSALAALWHSPYAAARSTPVDTTQAIICQSAWSREHVAERIDAALERAATVASDPTATLAEQSDTSKYRLILVFGGWGRLARALAVPSVH